MMRRSPRSSVSRSAQQRAGESPKRVVVEARFPVWLRASLPRPRVAPWRRGQYASGMQIVSIPCRTDNYAYLLLGDDNQGAVVVDPSEAEPVWAEIEKRGITLDAIWNTHHHFDHVGGNKELLERFPEAQVVAHESDKGRVPGQNLFVAEGDEVRAGTSLRAEILFNPGHTSGAISFYMPEHEALFTGDTLFAAGCGRLFEGTAAQMYESLSKLTALPTATRIYCGHEYTLANLRFAAAVEPGNEAITARMQRVQEQRDASEPSMGFTVAEERATNVFVRTQESAVVAAAREQGGLEGDDPVAVFAALRHWKDRF